MTKKDGWTPYGLEAIRVSHLRRRRILAAILVLGLVSAWMLMFETTTTTEQEIFANGNRVGGRLQINVPEQEQQEDRPVTISLSPGRVTRADTSQETGGSTTTRPDAPVISRAAPYNWTAYLIIYGPFFLIAAAAWMLGKRRRATDEVNFGVYKGAMPLELVTASSRQSVLTRRFARASVFGKRRQDHLPSHVLAGARVQQEEDA